MLDRLIVLIRSIVATNDQIVTADTNLFEDLGFDSLQLLGLINSIETEFSFHLPEEDLVIENFVTPAAIVAVILRNVSALQ